MNGWTALLGHRQHHHQLMGSNISIFYFYCSQAIVVEIGSLARTHTYHQTQIDKASCPTIIIGIQIDEMSESMEYSQVATQYHVLLPRKYKQRTWNLKITFVDDTVTKFSLDFLGTEFKQMSKQCWQRSGYYIH